MWLQEQYQCMQLAQHKAKKLSWHVTDHETSDKSVEL